MSNLTQIHWTTHTFGSDASLGKYFKFDTTILRSICVASTWGFISNEVMFYPPNLGTEIGKMQALKSNIFAAINDKTEYIGVLTIYEISLQKWDLKTNIFTELAIIGEYIFY